ncbi:transcriptional regulator [Eubacterium multiforme]|uniref:Transcriptional regulator n=1 Tax=Eubacterium multiforme TaxID=83339 RepID=A0ABT9USQ9_9FIRM|nr:transcriptional regulator [Eubacterium multiforme]MDQ0149367.1 hypothetical protein [Eubacterium multiforme]
MESRYYFVKDVMKMLEVKETKAYAIIRELNEEPNKNGYITVAGRVSKRYFDKRYYI